MTDLRDVVHLTSLNLKLPEPRVELEVDEGGRAERGLPPFEIAQVVLKVPVVASVGIFIAFQPFADEQDRQSRRNIQTLLGACDADVDSKRVHIQLFGEECADDIDNQ